MLAALGSALSDSISASLACISESVPSRPSRCLSNRIASADVSARDFRSDSISASSVDNFCDYMLIRETSEVRFHTSCSRKRCFRQTSASRTACKAGVSSPDTYVSVKMKSFRNISGKSPLAPREELKCGSELTLLFDLMHEAMCSFRCRSGLRDRTFDHTTE